MQTDLGRKDYSDGSVSHDSGSVGQPIVDHISAGLQSSIQFQIKRQQRVRIPVYINRLTELQINYTLIIFSFCRSREGQRLSTTRNSRRTNLTLSSRWIVSRRTLRDTVEIIEIGAAT